jgi:hypothetical protein
MPKTPWELPALYARLRQRRAFAIPHHTGYEARWRGKDWDIHDEELSPVMEIFSSHGSSEGCATPAPLETNESMGPRVTEGTYQAALARGLRIGAIGSNDGSGLPGRWGLGRAAVLAESCTREAIWQAIAQRRTYAVTGDRMLLDLRVEGAPMGSVIRTGRSVDVEVAVTGSHAIDRVELLRNNVVADTYCHAGTWEEARMAARRVKVEMELGWGPVTSYGLDAPGSTWDGRLTVSGGRLAGIEKCFSLFGQRVDALDETTCSFHLVTAGRTQARNANATQSLVFEIVGDRDAQLELRTEGVRLETSVAALLGK